MTCVLMVCLLGTPGASALVVSEPTLVGGNEPFRLVARLVGTFTEPPGGFEPRVVVDGHDILVYLRLGDGVAEPVEVHLFSADIDPLPAGDYEVRILGVQGDLVQELESSAISVGGTHVSASIEPDFAVAGEPIRLTLRGEAPAVCAGVPPYLDEGVLVVPFHPDCSVVTPPPPPTPFEFVTPPLVLPAGIYPIVVGDEHFPYLVSYLRGRIEVVPDPVTLHDGLFEVSVAWQDFEGQTGDGLPAMVPSEDSALFWFFGPDNWELMVKVLDACDLNGKYWVLGAASTTVAYDVSIEGPGAQTWTFSNPLGKPSDAFADVAAFDCVDVVPAPDPDPPPDLPLAGLHGLRLEPVQVVSGLPTRAIVWGTTSCCAPGLRRVERIGRTIRIHLDFADAGILSFSTYQLTADLGVLDEGAWDVQVVGDPESGQLQQLARAAVEVERGVEVRTEPSRPLADDEVRLFVRGFGTCPSLQVDSIVGRRITALWSPGGCLSPPGNFENSEPLGRLEPGTYEVEVRHWNSERGLTGGTTFEVLGAPIALQGGRFTLDVDWRDFENRTGRGRLVRSPSPDSALLWFFGPDNWELMVKVLDACDVNGHYWVLGAASTTVEVDLALTDQSSDARWTFHNDLGTASPAFADILAFPCSGDSP